MYHSYRQCQAIIALAALVNSAHARIVFASLGLHSMHCSGVRVALPHMFIEPHGQFPPILAQRNKEAYVHGLFWSGELYCWPAHLDSCEIPAARTT